jgi:hypothetical protein
MAADKTNNLTAFLTDIATTIRTAEGTTADIDPQDFSDRIEALPATVRPNVGRAETTLTVTADDTNDKLTIVAANNQGTGYVTGANKTASTTVTLTASGKTVTASDGSKSISKSVATATQATPSVSINSSGLITATATQSAGYVSAGTKSGTKQLTTQAAKTITPSTSSQTAVAKNVYTTGAVTVAAIPSKYEDVGAETTEYTSLNAELEAVINSLPEAGGGGGGSVETCTVEITADDGYVNRYIATVFQNGEYDCAYSAASALLPTPISIPNVVCGTFVFVESTYGLSGFTCTNCEFFRYGSNSGYFKITAGLEGVATIRCYDND